MADSLFLSLWFSDFSGPVMLARAACVLRQFPFSASRPGIGHVAVHSVSWSEPPVLQQTFDYSAEVEHALGLAAEFLHADNAYVFEAVWDLWAAGPDKQWSRRPHLVRFVVQGRDFEEGASKETGDIQVDLGLDAPFIFEELALDSQAEARCKQNIQQLVDFTAGIEKHCGISSRLLWSESEENLAQKLVARLQKLQ